MLYGSTRTLNFASPPVIAFPMIPTYAWGCHSCDVTNASGRKHCVACGFPAVASGTSISRARAKSRTPGAGRASVTPGPAPASTPSPDTGARLPSVIPVWRIALGNVRLGLACLGATMFKALVGWTETGVGLLLVTAGIGALAVATKSSQSAIWQR
jgi:hypothetical protein